MSEHWRVDGDILYLGDDPGGFVIDGACGAALLAAAHNEALASLRERAEQAEASAARQAEGAMRIARRLNELFREGATDAGS